MRWPGNDLVHSGLGCARAQRAVVRKRRKRILISLANLFQDSVRSERKHGIEFRQILGSGRRGKLSREDDLNGRVVPNEFGNENHVPIFFPWIVDDDHLTAWLGLEVEIVELGYRLPGLLLFIEERGRMVSLGVNGPFDEGETEQSQRYRGGPFCIFPVRRPRSGKRRKQ